MEINYLPILTKTTKNTFSAYIHTLNIPQIDYIAIGIQNCISKKSISLMSRSEWQKHFVFNQYAEYDPIRRIAFNTKRNLIPFNEIDFIDNYGKEIMRQRALMEIKNGIILMERFSKYNYMITLGTGFSRFNAFDFIRSYHDKIANLKRDLIQLVRKDTLLFLPKEVLNKEND